MIEAIESELPFKITRYEAIQGGFSQDQKFKLYTDHQPYLLKVVALEEAESRAAEFEIMKEAISLGVKCNQPIQFGTMPELNICFSLFAFLEGIDAEKGLVDASLEAASLIGIDAGKDLRKLHQIVPTIELASWQERIIKKHRRYQAAYEKGNYTFPQDRVVLDFIENHLSVLTGTEIIFQHDDFHLGNIIVKNGSYAGVIDFNRMDWGDYVHDFVKMAWFSRSKSVPFAKGQLQGYFDGQIPDYFWPRYNLYVAMSIFSTIVWHEQYFPKLLKKAEKLLYMILDDQNNFNQLVPKWAN